MWRRCIPLLALAFGATAQSHVRAVHMSAVQPQAEFEPASGGDWQPAIVGQSVVEGMKIRTGPADRAEVQLECGSAVRLDFNSEIAWRSLALTAKGVRLSAAQLLAGSLQASIYNDDQKGFEIDFGAGRLSVTSGASVRVDLGAPGAPARVEATAGKAVLNFSGKPYRLDKDQMVSFDSAGRATRGASANPGDAFSAWARERDQSYHAALAKARFAAPAVAGIPDSSNAAPFSAPGPAGGGFFGPPGQTGPGGGEAVNLAPPNCGP